MYYAVMTDAFTLVPRIVEVDFEIRYHEALEKDYIYVVKGYVTGYESANVKEITKDYVERSMFANWIACAGTYRKWHRLEIPMSEVVKFLLDNDLIEVERKYGYIKNIIWKEVKA